MFNTFKTNMTLFFQTKNGTASGVISPEDMPEPFMVDIVDEDGNVIGQEFNGGEEGIESELKKLAKAIADEYHLAIGTAYQQKGGTSRLINPAVYNGPMLSAKQGIESAILGVLKAMHSEKGPKPSIVLMLPIAASIIAYWSTALSPGSFLPVPMPLTPLYTSPSPGTIVLFPGNPRPIAKGFKDAFSRHDNERDFNTALSKMLDDIIKGFEDHLASISGIYIGMVPAPPTIVPVVLPWKGVKVQ